MMRYVSIAIMLALPVAAASPETPAGVVGVDVLDGASGELVEHIDVTA